MNDRISGGRGNEIEKEGIIKQRKNFFDKIMNIVDEAKGARDSKYGPFSLLKEKYYVRSAMVSSTGKIATIAGLKTVLAIDALEMHNEKKSSRIVNKEFQKIIEGKSEKKYDFDYTVLDKCLDVEENKTILCEKLYPEYTPDKITNNIKYLLSTEELIPYFFMDKLRSFVWDKLRDFFKLCEQNVCSQCSMKSVVYFQFVQAVALYEIFYLSLIQEQAVKCVEKETEIVNQIAEQLHKTDEIVNEMKKADLSLEKVLEIQKAVQELNNNLDDTIMKDFYDKSYYLEIYQLLVMEFGISYYAMCNLLMLMEAMQASKYEIRNLEELGLKIRENLNDKYDRDIALPEKMNDKRVKRYREVNIRVEKLLENQYLKVDENGRKNYDEDDVIYTFMTEVCKSARSRNKDVFRGLEIILGYPLYCEKKMEIEMEKSDELA